MAGSGTEVEADNLSRMNVSDSGESEEAAAVKLTDENTDFFFAPTTNDASQFVVTSENGYSEEVSKNKWTCSIPGRGQEEDLVALEPIKEVNMGRALDSVEMASARMTFGILGHFVERGLFSGHAYVGEGVNHRDCIMSSWWNTTADKRIPMVQSVVDPVDASCYLDVGHLISLLFYAVVDTRETEVMSTVRLRSPCRLAYKGQNAYAYARNRAMTAMTGKEFKRLLLFFGYKWVDALGAVKGDDVQPDFPDILGFCELFRGVDLSNQAGFRHFYETFRFQKVFTYDVNEPMSKIHDKFGFVFRSYQPVRACAFDGQHRAILMGYFLTGHFQAASVIPMQQKPWDTTVFHANSYEKMVVFQELNFSIGIPKTNGVVDTNIRKIQRKAYNAGNCITEAAHHSKDPTWTEFMQKVAGLVKNEDRDALVFSNFWARGLEAEPPLFTSNSKVLGTALTRVLQEQPRFDCLMVDANGQQQVKEPTKACLFDGLLAVNNLGKNGGLRVECKEVMQVFRCAIETRTGIENFLSFLDSTSALRKQIGTDNDKCSVRFQNALWIRKNLYSIVEKIVEHFMVRYFAERYIIEELRRAEADSPLKSGLPDSKWNKQFLLKWPSASQWDDIIPSKARSIFGINNKAGSLEKRLEYAFWCAILEDIMLTMSTFGMDPDFFVDCVGAGNLTDDAKAAQKVFDERWESSYQHVLAEYQSREYTLVSGKGGKVKDKYLMEYQDDDELGEDDDEDEVRMKKYNIYFDVQEHLLENAGSPEMKGNLQRFLYNRVARDYLDPDNATDFKMYEQQQSSDSQRVFGGGQRGAQKFSMELFLQLYPAYVRLVDEIDFPGLSLFKGCEGPRSKLFKGNPKNVKGGVSFGQGNSGLYPDCRDRFPTLTSVLQDKVRFSTFVNMALSDRFDLDQLVAFRDHCKTGTEMRRISNILKHQVKDGYNAEQRSLTNGGGDTQKLAKVNYNIKQLGDMMSSPDVSMDTAVRVFMFLRERNAVKLKVVGTELKTPWCDYAATGTDLVEDRVYKVKFSEIEALIPVTYEDHKKQQEAEKNAKKSDGSRTPGKKRKSKSKDVIELDSPERTLTSPAAISTRVGSSPARIDTSQATEHVDAAMREVDSVVSRKRKNAMEENKSREKKIKDIKATKQQREREAKEAKKKKAEAKKKEAEAKRKLAAAAGKPKKTRTKGDQNSSGRPPRRSPRSTEEEKKDDKDTRTTAADEEKDDQTVTENSSGDETTM